LKRRRNLNLKGKFCNPYKGDGTLTVPIYGGVIVVEEK
jgi:hypothetical protein